MRNEIKVGDKFYLKNPEEGENRTPFIAQWLYGDGTAYIKQLESPCLYGAVGPNNIGEVFVREEDKP